MKVPLASASVRVSTSRVVLTKRHALTISRGTITGSTNVVLRVEHDGIVGLGEMAPSDVTSDTVDAAELAVAAWQEPLIALSPLERQRAAAVVAASPAGSAAQAALDMAC